MDFSGFAIADLFRLGRCVRPLLGLATRSQHVLVEVRYAYVSHVNSQRLSPRPGRSGAEVPCFFFANLAADHDLEYQQLASHANSYTVHFGLDLWQRRGNDCLNSISICVVPFPNQK